MEQDYININKMAWNYKVASHVGSAFYDMPGFLNNPQSLNDIELSILGSVEKLNILHLQCHFGQDSISLSKLGANVTGVDFSEKAIEQAQLLTQQLQTNTQFICSDIYNLPQYLKQQFDIVFTSYGTIGWLPDLDRWANIIQFYLKPGGRFVMADFHPVIWMYDDHFKEVTYNYFKDAPIEEVINGTYADRNAAISTRTISWNHSISEILNSLLQQGLQLKQFNEYDYSPYNCFNETITIAPKKYQIKHFNNKIPMVYAIEAVKPI
ncbi:class I SAM-dependent methyltransferase [Ferruginibacter yonginensis]|uniref:Class I SAM-dependent methyltransferase n=1 Tax=Ferruginibacter yonginensis TaxID=1310416 RepID=A0ABV8QVY9_9BACT